MSNSPHMLTLPLLAAAGWLLAAPAFAAQPAVAAGASVPAPAADWSAQKLSPEEIKKRIVDAPIPEIQRQKFIQAFNAAQNDPAQLQILLNGLRMAESK
ncbi:hypothetical protein FGG78_41615 [Thioclava sp. BHET1]|nr:hypothetical protein FGG78_41615 [Thioclava sp. BHET1]